MAVFDYASGLPSFAMNFPKEFQKWNDATGNFWTNNCMDIRVVDTTAQ